MWGKGGSWNSGPVNGYDLGVVVRQYMAGIGKRHLSFVEAVLEGKVDELLPLKDEVGSAHAFYSRIIRRLKVNTRGSMFCVW